MSRIELRMKWVERIREFQTSGQSARSGVSLSKSVYLRYWILRFHHQILPSDVGRMPILLVRTKPTHGPEIPERKGSSCRGARLA